MINTLFNLKIKIKYLGLTFGLFRTQKSQKNLENCQKNISIENLLHSIIQT